MKRRQNDQNYRILIFLGGQADSELTPCAGWLFKCQQEVFRSEINKEDNQRLYTHTRSESVLNVNK